MTRALPGTVPVGPAESGDAITAQEVRFAVAMSGGVSLAVWMGGVAREMNLLQEASNLRQSRNLPVSADGSGSGSAGAGATPATALTAGRMREAPLTGMPGAVNCTWPC